MSYRKVSGTIFLIIAIVHVIRAVRQLPVHIGDSAVPVWVSWVGAMVALALTIWAFRDRS